MRNKLAEVFMSIAKRITPVPSSGNIQFEEELESLGCIISQYNSWMSNPSQGVMNYSNKDEWMKFMRGYCKAYKPVFIFKQSAGNNQFNYYQINKYFGTKIKV